MLKRVLGLILALCTVLSCVALIACNNKNAGEPTGTDPSTESPEPSGTRSEGDDTDDPDETDDVPGDTPSDPGATGGTDTPDIPDVPYKELPENYIPIAVNGVSEYVIRYPYPEELAMLSFCQQIAEAIKIKTGADVEIKSDFIVGNSKPGACEILVGNTNREESSKAVEGLSEGQFTVRLYDKKIVLNGKDTSGLYFAVGYFLSSVIEASDYGKNLGIEAGFNKTYTSSSELKINGVDISKFTIVLPEKFLGSDYRVAVYLKKHILDIYGANLEIFTDAQKYDHEILIGSTKRTTAAAPATAHGYSADVKDGAIQLQAASVYAYDALNAYLQTSFFNPVNDKYTNGYSVDKDITATLKDGQEYTTKRDADMRIMFFNMWGNSTTGYGPRDQHQMLAAEIVNAYAPDIIGFQEFNNHNRDDGWWSMDSLLEAYGYVEVDVSSYKNAVSNKYVTNDGTRPTNNFTPIFYNPDKVTVVEAKYRSYDTNYNDYGSKSLTWCVFKDNATQKLFAALSTHFWYKDDIPGNAARVENARVVNEEVSAILAKYPGLPVFAGGDFNCNPASDPYKKLLEGGFVDVQGIATRTEDHRTYHSKQEYDKMFVAGNKNVGIDINKNNEESDSKWMAAGYLGTWVKWYHPGGKYKDSIDHIFIHNSTADKLDVKMFDIVASKMALIASDHCPLICDFNLK